MAQTGGVPINAVKDSPNYTSLIFFCGGYFYTEFTPAHYLTILDGTPTAVELAGTSVITTAFAPIFASLPIKM